MYFYALNVQCTYILRIYTTNILFFRILVSKHFKFRASIASSVFSLQVFFGLLVFLLWDGAYFNSFFGHLLSYIAAPSQTFWASMVSIIDILTPTLCRISIFLILSSKERLQHLLQYPICNAFNFFLKHPSCILQNLM